MIPYTYDVITLRPHDFRPCGCAMMSDLKIVVVAVEAGGIKMNWIVFSCKWLLLWWVKRRSVCFTKKIVVIRDFELVKLEQALCVGLSVFGDLLSLENGLFEVSSKAPAEHHKAKIFLSV